MSLSPAEIRARLAEAFRLLSSGDLDGAEQGLNAVLAGEPGDVNALSLMAGLKRQRGDRVAALHLTEQALALAPNAAPIVFNRANLLLEMDRAAEALAAYDDALRLRPDHGDTHLNRGRVLAALNRHEEALTSYAHARALGADDARVWAMLGVSQAALERHEDAAVSFSESLKRTPNDADVQFNLGRGLQALERTAEAVAAYDAALKLDPRNAGAWDNRGVALHALERMDEARSSFDAALAIDPDRADTFSNRGLVLFDLKQPREAIADYDRALALIANANPTPPRIATIRYNRGMAYLRAHDLKQGWPGFEERWAAGMIEAQPRDRGEPRWRGERLDGALRIWPEQGIGDEILFARLAPKARERTARVILECAPRLVPLYARSFPTLEVRSATEEAPPCAAQIAAGSLGGALDAGGDDLDGGAAFLRAAPEKVAELRARYMQLAAGRPIIGIAWASKSPKRGAHKSADLNHWGALLKRDALFVNLQYGEARGEAVEAERAFGCTIYDDPEIDQMRDLDAFAAQIAALDRIVSVSNTTVHLAGALGAPCIVMVPPGRGRLWYWGFEGERTPWYASVRIVRRALNEAWPTQVAAATTLCFGELE